MPKKGEEVTIDDFVFKITSADSRRIQTFHITVPKDHKINGKITD